MEDAASELVEGNYRRAVHFARTLFPKDPEAEGNACEILCWAADDWVSNARQGAFWPWAMAFIRYRMIDDWRRRFGRQQHSFRRRRQSEVSYGDVRFRSIPSSNLRVNPQQRQVMGSQPIEEDLIHDPHGLTPEEVVVGELQADHIMEMLEERLSESERRVLELRLAGLTQREVGELLGFTESRACQLQSRAKEKLEFLL